MDIEALRLPAGGGGDLKALQSLLEYGPERQKNCIE